MACLVAERAKSSDSAGSGRSRAVPSAALALVGRQKLHVGKTQTWPWVSVYAREAENPLRS